MKIGPLTASALLALSLAAGRAAAQTADPGASARTKAVLAYVRSLTEGGGRRVLSGQFLEFAPNATLSLPEACRQGSGKWPAYIGVDYMNFRTQSIDTEAADRVSIDYWGQGGLVEVNVHLTNRSEEHTSE